MPEPDAIVRFRLAALLALVLALASGARVDGEPSGARRSAPGRQAAAPPAPDSASVAALMLTGRLAEADSAGAIWVARVEATEGLEALATAKALDLWNEAHRRSGHARGQEALEPCERAVRIKERLLGPDDSQLAASLQNLGMFHYARGEGAAARSPLERAVSIAERAVPVDSVRLGRGLAYVAALDAGDGEDGRAARLLERALRIEAATLGPDHPDVGLAHGARGAVLMKLNDFAGAAEEHRAALRITRAATGEGSLQTADAMHELGVALDALGEVQAAGPLFRKSFAIRSALLDPHDPTLATDLETLARWRQRTGDRVGALADARNAVYIWESQPGNRADLARTLTQVCALARQAGRLGEARRAGERSIAMLDSLFDRSQQTVDALVALSAAEDAAGDAASCREHLARLRIAVESDSALTLNNQALAYQFLADRFLRDGSDSLALEFSLRAERARRAHFVATAQQVSEREALGYGVIRAEGRGLALAAATRIGTLSPLLASSLADAVVRSRALVLETMQARLRLDARESDPLAREAIDSLGVARTRLARLVVRGPEPGNSAAFSAAYQAAQDDVDQHERALARRDLGAGAERARMTAGIAEVSAALPEGSALVSYLRIDRDPESSVFRKDGAYFAMTIVAGGTPRFIELGSLQVVEGAIAAWRREVLRGAELPSQPFAAENRCRSAGYRARRLVWEPLAAQIAGAGRVFVVPDGALTLVNLAALPADHEAYLADSLEFHRLGTERDLVLAASEQDPLSGPLLAVGAPEFNDPIALVYRGTSPESRTPVRRGLGRVRFASLPETAREVDAISSVWEGAGGQVDRLTGRMADERTVKEEASKATVIHLASHGFFVEGTAGGRRQGRRGIGRISSAAPRGLPVGGLRLSGIALAGANTRGQAADQDEDGVLTAEEIATLDLRKTRWAVLSGCDTGLGTPLTGEGVLGLERSFRLAGARTVIMSLWGVEDAAARRWMTSVYQSRFRERRSTIDAVTEACRSVLAERRAHAQSTHPFYWAAFVASGDWR